MLFYVSIIAIASLIASLDSFKKRSKAESYLIFFTSALIMFIPLAMRDCGVDYDTYQLNYQNISATDWSIYWKGYSGSPEMLYIILNYAAFYLFHSFQGVNFLCALLSISFTFCGLYKFKDYLNVGMSVWCFGFLYYILMYGLNRMMIAVAIITWGYQYIASKDFPKFAFWVTIAGLFHYSAFLMIPFYFIILYLDANRGLLKNLKGIKVLFGTFLLFVVIYLLVPLVFGRFSWYVRYESYFNLSINIAALNNNFPTYFVVAFIFIMHRRLKQFLKQNHCFITMLYLYIACCCVSVVMPIHRICYFFYPNIIILCGVITKSGKQASLKTIHKSNAVVFNVSMIIVGMLWLYQFLGLGGLWASCLNPYKMGNFI